MLKEKIRESGNSLSHKQRKWRNLLFDKNERSYRGCLLFDTQHQAENWIQEKIAEQKNPDSKYSGWNTMDGEIKKEDYTWHMQIPILS